eukprot:TRINITY_DN23864_c0_g1_i1.p1 TRINITY_DN23864_c0_g1~~TRINITY_DN23864_c0_g1_i1.p1  ORF type:complete len:468 (+),score=35.05 TRINITY_DN23864_c0_g1_i1:60-1406(+)
MAGPWNDVPQGVYELLAHAENGRWNDVKSIVQSSPRLLDVESQPDESPSVLHHAAAGNSCDVVCDVVDIVVRQQGQWCLTALDAEGKTPLDIASERGNDTVLELMKARLENDRHCRFGAECELHADEHRTAFVHPMDLCPRKACEEFRKLLAGEPLSAAGLEHIREYRHLRTFDNPAPALEFDDEINGYAVPGMRLKGYYSTGAKDFGDLKEEVEKNVNSEGSEKLFPKGANAQREIQLLVDLAREKASHPQHDKVKRAMADIRPEIDQRLQYMKRTHFRNYGAEQVGDNARFLQNAVRQECSGREVECHLPSFTISKHLESICPDIRTLVLDDGLSHNELLAVVLYCCATELCSDLRKSHREANVARWPKWNTHLSRAVTKLWLFDDSNDCLRLHHSLENPQKVMRKDLETVMMSPIFYHGINGIGDVPPSKGPRLEAYSVSLLGEG